MRLSTDGPITNCLIFFGGCDEEPIGACERLSLFDGGITEVYSLCFASLVPGG